MSTCVGVLPRVDPLSRVPFLTLGFLTDKGMGALRKALDGLAAQDSRLELNKAEKDCLLRAAEELRLVILCRERYSELKIGWPVGDVPLDLLRLIERETGQTTEEAVNQYLWSVIGVLQFLASASGLVKDGVTQVEKAGVKRALDYFKRLSTATL